MGKNIVMATGGTGGPLYPAIAVAEAFERLGPELSITFVGTSRGLEVREIPKTKWPLKTLEVPKWVGTSSLEKIAGSLKLLRATWEARRFLKYLRPGLVFGFGGYPSVPAVVAAQWIGIPTALLLPDRIPGVANRYLSKRAKKIFVGFEKTAKGFPAQKVFHYGIPVRHSLFREAGEIEREENPFVLFVFGGSQGSVKINELFLKALGGLKSLREKIHVVHQVGRQTSVEAVRSFYREEGWSAEVYDFISNMGLHYKRAHLAIARAGASTIAELLAIGRASILIPYPYARGHQRANAQELANLGLARFLEETGLTPEILAQSVRELFEDRPRLKAMEEKIKTMGYGNAADKIARECLEAFQLGIPRGLAHGV